MSILRIENNGLIVIGEEEMEKVDQDRGAEITEGTEGNATDDT